MIKKEEVQHIAKLARLGITKKEEEKFQKDLSSILDYFNSLKKVNVSGVEPTLHPAEQFLKRKIETMREDKAESQSEGVAGELVKVAPDRKKEHIRVKAVF